MTAAADEQRAEMLRNMTDAELEAGATELREVIRELDEVILLPVDDPRRAAAARRAIAAKRLAMSQIDAREHDGATERRLHSAVRRAMPGPNAS